VDAHTHLALNLLRGVADDLPLAQWLSEQIWPTEARLVDEDFVRAGTRAACAELIRGGVTTINEMYWFPESVAEAIRWLVKLGSRWRKMMRAWLMAPARAASARSTALASGASFMGRSRLCAPSRTR
jgi:cytosine/adenosine deaminase-related metal-dependent hydrolase